jgi:hypothetical protein
MDGNMELHKYIQKLIDTVEDADNGMLDGEQYILNCLYLALADNESDFNESLDNLVKHIEEI